MIPNGTTSMTAVGIDQLSYSAARHRNTTISEIAYSAGACEPERRSSKDRPVHSKPTPTGSLAANRSISSMAAPEL
ncbi:hypothetical protein G6F68_021093 [Rhizopus microsporus]|nr:hypothetical protein G6F68_021093 [Rhizopus microsporus]